MGGGHSKRRNPTPTSQSLVSKKSSEAVITDIDKAVLDLKIARDKLGKLIHRIHIDAELLLQRSKDAYTKNQRTISVGLLRLRKVKLNQVESIQNQLLTIAQLTSHIESKEYEKQVLTALQNGKNALEKLNSLYSVEDIVQLMDQVHEQSELEREINSVLIHAGEHSLTALQESQVEAEFFALTQEQEKKVFVLDLPLVPNTKPLPITPTKTSTAMDGDPIQKTDDTTAIINTAKVMIPG